MQRFLDLPAGSSHAMFVLTPLGDFTMLHSAGSTDPGANPGKALFRNPLFYTSCVIVFIALYVGWVFFSRYRENQAIRRKAVEERTEKQRESDRAAIEQLGGSDFAIQSFYASPGIIRRKQSSQICYNVSNAKTVTLDPPDANVWPSHYRCFDVTPSKTTTYTLTITGQNGQTQSATLTIKVE
jgi:hypothetical protein